MPRNGLALAIRIGCEDQLFSPFDRAGNVGHTLDGLAVDLPQHRKIVIGIDRAVFGRQIADMAKGSQNLITGPKIFVDGFGLGRRLNDNKLHSISLGFINGERCVTRINSAGKWWIKGFLSNPNFRIREFATATATKTKRKKTSPEFGNACVKALGVACARARLLLVHMSYDTCRSISPSPSTRD